MSGNETPETGSDTQCQCPILRPFQRHKNDFWLCVLPSAARTVHRPAWPQPMFRLPPCRPRVVCRQNRHHRDRAIRAHPLVWPAYGNAAAFPPDTPRNNSVPQTSRPKILQIWRTMSEPPSRHSRILRLVSSPGIMVRPFCGHFRAFSCRCFATLRVDAVCGCCVQCVHRRRRPPGVGAVCSLARAGSGGRGGLSGCPAAAPAGRCVVAVA